MKCRCSLLFICGIKVKSCQLALLIYMLASILASMLVEHEMLAYSTQNACDNVL